jgi:hypothetical protein
MTVKVGDKIRVLETGYYNAEVSEGDILIVRAFSDNYSGVGTFIADTEDGSDWWFFNSNDLDIGFELVKEETKSTYVTNIVNNLTVKNPEEIIKAIESSSFDWKAFSDNQVMEDKLVSIDSHYDFFYDLKPHEAEFLQIKTDPYFVSKQWRVGERDPSGALFHILKTIARFGDKNPKEREIKAIYLQIKRLAELEGVELE